jgi:8-oxo-dGTP pyrophosphatase MutT (NUDIX family)
MIDAAILIPVYRSNEGELHIVMVLRNSGGVHGGQIAFPGGKRDPQDETMVDTALREVREELGITVTKDDVLAELPMENTRTTGYRVFPYLARITAPDQRQIAEREIAAILDVKLSYLTRADSQDKMIGRLPNWHRSEEIPFYRTGDDRLWGLSYRILRPVIPRLVAGEWNV